ncbi:trypsin-like serine protease [Backusella circina FSU 941]|nr:trypsin-like serine protease [Backusella circina FSU 941]
MYDHISIITLVLISVLYKATAVTGISEGRAVDSSNAYPFAVKLTYPSLCGGTIISLDPPWILTAAHCLQGIQDLPQNEPTVAYGSAYNEEQKYATIKRAIVNPLYRSAEQTESSISDDLDTIPYDIALIQLKETLIENQNTNRVPIYNEHEQIKTTNTSLFETVGMGYVGYGKSEPSVLQLAICNKTTDLLQENNFNHSVTLVTSNSVLCHGDSGGALIYRNGTSSMDYQMTGILSRIINAYDPYPENASCPLHDSEFTHFVNAFVRPSTHIDWIMNVTNLPRSALTAPIKWSSNASAMGMKSSSSALEFNSVYILIILITLLHIN